MLYQCCHIIGNTALVWPSCGERETGGGVFGGGSEEPLGQRLVGATLSHGELRNKKQQIGCGNV